MNDRRVENPGGQVVIHGISPWICAQIERIINDRAGGGSYPSGLVDCSNHVAIDVKERVRRIERECTTVLAQGGGAKQSGGAVHKIKCVRFSSRYPEQRAVASERNIV